VKIVSKTVLAAGDKVLWRISESPLSVSMLAKRDPLAMPMMRERHVVRGKPCTRS
jgi:hypothetical protein